MRSPEGGGTTRELLTMLEEIGDQLELGENTNGCGSTRVISDNSTECIAESAAKGRCRYHS